MLVLCVNPVAILRALFFTICSLSMFVSDALGDHMFLRCLMLMLSGPVDVVGSC